MKSRFLLLILASAAISSCSTAYKTGQTPDDVYYSPGRNTEEYVESRQDDRPQYNNYSQDNSQDRWLRMRVRNPYRWNAFDDYDWNTYSTWNNNWYSPYSYSWNSYWNGYWNWNSFYNPYCRNVVVVNPKGNPGVYNKVRNFSLNSYTNTNYNNNNRTVTKSGTRLPGGGYTTSGYNNSNNSGSLGNSLKKVFSSNSNSGYSNTNSSYSPSSSGSDRSSSRSYTPSSSGSSGGSSGGSSSGSSSGGSSSGRRGG